MIDTVKAKNSEANLDLRDFISNSIFEIAEATKIADEKLKHMGGMVNPGTHAYGAENGKSVEIYVAPRTSLNFDVALTASNSKDGGADVKAKIFVVEASIGGKGEFKNESVSRLSFSIDVVLPHDSDQKVRVGAVQKPHSKA